MNRRQTREKKRASINPRTQAAAPKTSAPVLLISAALIAITLAVFAPVRNFDFVEYDDQDYVADNAHVKAGLTTDNVVWAFTTGHAANWHPVTWLSHMFDVELFGMNPGALHLVNVLLHIGSTLLLFGFLYRSTGKHWHSAFVAACFAVHPLHVESVAWIAERKDVLSGFFWMSTLFAYAMYVRQRTPARYVAVLACFVLGLMAKPVLVTLPFVMLLLDIWPFERAITRSVVLEKLPFVALAAVSSIITFQVQRSGGAVARLDQVAWTLRASNGIVSYVAYIGDMLWPARLAVFYPLPQSISSASAVLSLLALGGVTVAVLRGRKRRPYLPVGWFWYLGTLVPMIGLVQVGNQARADRYTYIPLIGLFIIIAWGATDFLQQTPAVKKALAVAAGLVILACVNLANAQVSYWKDSSALWTRAEAVTTGNYAAHNGLGLIRMKEGKAGEASAHYNAALLAKPDYVEARNNLGNALTAQRRFSEAISEYQKAIRLSADNAEAHYNLASALAVTGKPAEAIAELTEAIRIRPTYSHAHNNLGFALVEQGQYEQAIRHLNEALKVEPALYNAHYGLALAYEKMGRIDDAIRECNEAVRIRPDYREALQKLNRLQQGNGAGK